MRLLLFIVVLFLSKGWNHLVDILMHAYHFLFDAFHIMIISFSFSFIFFFWSTASKWCCGVFIALKYSSRTFSHTQLDITMLNGKKSLNA